MTEMEEFLRDDEPFMIRHGLLKNWPITKLDSRPPKKVRSGTTRRVLRGSVAGVRLRNRDDPSEEDCRRLTLGFGSNDKPLISANGTFPLNSREAEHSATFCKIARGLVHHRSVGTDFLVDT